MANVTVTTSQPNVTVNSTTQTVNVSTTTSNIIVSNTASVGNTVIRKAISVENVSGFGNLAYDSTNSANGVIQYTGVSTTDIRGSISNTAPILYNSTTGVIDIDDAALFSGKTTDDLAEGNTNLYFSNIRAREAIFQTTSSPQPDYFTSGGGLSITSDGSSAQWFLTANTDLIPEGTNNLYFSGKNTDNLIEGSTNLYFTDDRVNEFLLSGNQRGPVLLQANSSLSTSLQVKGRTSIYSGNIFLNGSDSSFNNGDGQLNS